MAIGSQAWMLIAECTIPSQPTPAQDDLLRLVAVVMPDVTSAQATYIKVRAYIGCSCRVHTHTLAH